MELDIKTKYSVGDKVLAKADKMIRQICPFCDGKGKKTINETTIYCQNCDDGYLVTRSNKSCYVPATIKGINTNVQKIETWEENDDYVSTGDNKTIILVEYYVSLDDEENYYGNGTYREEKLKDFEKE